MLSHPGGWDKPIPEVIYLWRHRTSTPNKLEKSRLVCVLDIFWTFLDKNEKNNQSLHWGRDEGIPSSCPRFATSTTRQASSWIANLGHLDGIPSSLPQCGVRLYYYRTSHCTWQSSMMYFCPWHWFVFKRRGVNLYAWASKISEHFVSLSVWLSPFRSKKEKQQQTKQT